jgi:hypothetical protein
VSGCVRRAAYRDGATLREIKVLPPECRKLTLPKAGAQREVMRASSRVPSAAESRRDASSCESARMGLCLRLARPARGGPLTRAVGLEGMRLSSTAWFRAVERTPCVTPTVFGFNPSSILRTLNERTWAALRSRSFMRPKNGIR